MNKEVKKLNGLKRLKKDKENNKEKTVKEKVFFDPLATKEAETIKETLAATHIAEEINSRMMRENFLHDFQRSPEDAFVIWGMIGDNFDYAKWIEKEFNALVEMVAKDTGADPAQIADKEKRTKEQDDLLLKAGAKRTLARIEAYFHSKFNDAIKTLEEVQGNYKDPKDIPEENFFPMPLKEQTALYFFALHSEIDQREQTPLTEEQKKEIKNIFARVDDFAQQYAKESDKNTLGYNIIQAFINKEYPKKKADTIKEELRIKSKTIQKPLYPVDVVNENVWRHSFNKNKIAVKNASITYTINFEELKKQGVTITTELTAYDKRAYIAAANLFKAGNEYFSIAQLHKAMGNNTAPSTNQIKKLNESLTKMGMARIFIDNKEESKKFKNVKHYRYDGVLLPFERVQGGAYINNTFTETVIHLFRDPPLFSFAAQRKQVLSTPKELLAIPLSQTEGNLRIIDYLLVKINAIKKKSITNKITWETFFKRCDADTRLKKFQAKEKVKTCLEHFKQQLYIKEYQIDEESIKIKY